MIWQWIAETRYPWSGSISSDQSVTNLGHHLQENGKLNLFTGCHGRSLGHTWLLLQTQAQPATKAWFVDQLWDILSVLGLPPEVYIKHSFCIGAATTAALMGVEDCTTQTLDRWQTSSNTSECNRNSWPSCQGVDQRHMIMQLECNRNSWPSCQGVDQRCMIMQLECNRNSWPSCQGVDQRCMIMQLECNRNSWPAVRVLTRDI